MEYLFPGKALLSNRRDLRLIWKKGIEEKHWLFTEGAMSWQAIAHSGKEVVLPCQFLFTYCGD
jgi:hypothetical protein